MMLPDRLVHADWGSRSSKRQYASALRNGARWQIEAPRPVGSASAFVTMLFGSRGGTFAGFDFPIGVPVAYGRRTGLTDFPALLDAIGKGEWQGFYDVAAEPGQIGINRPFYPQGQGKGSTWDELVSAHGLAGGPSRPLAQL